MLLTVCPKVTVIMPREIPAVIIGWIAVVVATIVPIVVPMHLLNAKCLGFTMSTVLLCQSSH